MRSYDAHFFGADIFGDFIDTVALSRNVAAAMPDIAFRARFEHPMPTAFLEELERLEETFSIAMGRPELVPDD